MIEYKNKGANKIGGPFPFSAYVLRSYSSEPVDQSKPKPISRNLQFEK